MAFPLKFENNSSLFFTTLRKRVNAHFKENKIKKTGDYRMVLKSIVMFSIYFIPLTLILSGYFSTGGILALYFIMGIGLAGIGLSVMHDANHGSYSKNKTINKILSYSMNLIGGSSFTWKVQHNMLHHTYTNVYKLDEDIDDKVILRLSPHGKLMKIHRYQHWYALFLYSFATVSWLLKKDFAQLALYNKEGLTQQSGHNPSKETLIMIITKALYVSYMLVLPLLILDVSWWVIVLGFLIMHMVAGMILTTIFQLAHVVEGPKHEAPPTSGKIKNSWAIHQLLTTANFARKNRLMSWYVGGLNYQIEHHLFPNICHIHYKSISKIVKKTAKEFNLPYYDQPSFFSALASHLRMLKKLGRGEVVGNV